jgi:signal transduction histidine kinase
VDTLVRERLHLAGLAPAVIVGVVGLLAAGYVPLFVAASGLGPQVFGFPGADVLTSLAFGGMGFLIARRYPGNPMGWIMLAVAILSIVLGDAQLYALLIYRAGHENLPLAPVAAWLGSTLWGPAISLVPIGVLLFPDGNVRSQRWRSVLWACVALDAVFICAQALFILTTVVGGPVSIGLDGQVSALGGLCVGCSTKGHTGYADAFLASFPLLPLTLVLGAAGLITNTVHSQGERRQQMKWFMCAAALAAVGLVAYGVSQFAIGTGSATQAASAITMLGIAALPVGVAVAVFKYRLYDIDVVINRTMVYGSLAVFITAVYVGIAVGIGTLVGSGGKPNLGLSILATAVVAVGFQPVRERVQRVANRLVYGKRATPYEVLSQFSERVAESYASDDVLQRMARVLAEGTNADLAEVWLRTGDAVHREAVFPLQSSAPAAVDFNGSGEIWIPAVDRAVVVRHQGDALGALTVTKRRGESITPIEVKLMDDLAHQAGLVLKNVGLTADLQARLADLRASRQRLVAAQDDERRKLERNLHDGAQQYLVAIKVKLGLTEMLVMRDPVKAKAAVAELKHDADEALETLRDLARGIYPPLLADKGLPTALEAQARKATLPVIVDADGIGRYAQDTEAALYFCSLEALQNIQKYAQASRATVRLRATGNQLSVEVADDGRGFDVSTTRRGNGLTNMEDRLDALGGRMHLASSPGNGTTLRLLIPIPDAVRAGAPAEPSLSAARR